MYNNLFTDLNSLLLSLPSASLIVETYQRRLLLKNLDSIGVQCVSCVFETILCYDQV